MWWHREECKTYCVPHHDPINGYYTCDSLGRRKCMMGWYGEWCTTPCLSKDYNISGSCQGLRRSCEQGFSLPDCKQCEVGFYGKNCSQTCLLPGEINVGKIVCNDSGERMCRKWWFGKNCDVYCVPHDDNTNGHYICDKHGRKRCLIGWVIPECKVKSNN